MTMLTTDHVRSGVTRRGARRDADCYGCVERQRVRRQVSHPANRQPKGCSRTRKLGQSEWSFWSSSALPAPGVTAISWVTSWCCWTGGCVEVSL